MKNFEEFKSKRQQTEAYKVASQIQESFAFIGQSAVADNRQYEGHLAVMDVLNKIDSMVKMFEKTIQDNPSDRSSQKIVEVIAALYDLAQAKLSEAKKQCTSYMKKASGVTTTPSKPKPISSIPSSAPSAPSASSALSVPPTEPSYEEEPEYSPEDTEDYASDEESADTQEEY